MHPSLCKIDFYPVDICHKDTVGIVLCATQYLKKRIERGANNNRKGYKEIYSRIGRKFIPMPVVNRGDIKAVCMANGLEDRREIERIIEDSDNDLRRVKRLVHLTFEKGPG